MAGLWGRPGTEVWVRRACAVVVAVVAAYASYQHQREFAIHAGADGMAACLWPLSVDGLLVLASTSLLRSSPGGDRRARAVVWSAFLLGIAVSLAANIAAAPELDWQSVLVAGWPPISLLLAVELLTHRVSRDACETIRVEDETAVETRRDGETTAEGVMWEHFQRAQAEGRTPTGAELDRVAGTHTYGRAVLRRWRRDGRIPRPERVNGVLIDPPLRTAWRVDR